MPDDTRMVWRAVWSDGVENYVLAIDNMDATVGANVARGSLVRVSLGNPAVIVRLDPACPVDYVTYAAQYYAEPGDNQEGEPDGTTR